MIRSFYNYSINNGAKKRVVTTISTMAMLVVVSIGIILSSFVPITPAGASQPLEQWQVDGFSKISTKGNKTCGLTTQNQLYCWGRDSMATASDRANIVPTLFATAGTVLDDKVVSDVEVGIYSTCVIANNAPYCWGDNSYGQLGNGTTSPSSVPVAVDTSGVLAGKVVSKISIGEYYTCALADDTPYCWGDNSYGQLGNGTTSPSSVPVAVDTSGVLAGKFIEEIDAGHTHACSIADANLYCWGTNQYGQLGNGTTSPSSVPVAVDTSGVLMGKTVSKVSSGENFTCAVADGSPYCWGFNDSGQLGNGTTSQSSVPTAVLAAGSVSDISTGAFNACVLAQGLAYCWGRNYSLNLGNTTEGNALSPTPVDTSGVLLGKTISTLAVGGNHVCALSGATPYCWGDNMYSALGNNTYYGGTMGEVPAAYLPVTVTNNTPRFGEASYTTYLNSGYMSDIYLSGVGFVEGTVIEIDGVEVPTRFSNQFEVIAERPDSLVVKSVDITVKNPDGKSSTITNGLTYDYLAPTISSLGSLNLVTGASNQALIIYGSNYLDNAKVLFDDIEVTPTSITSNQIVLNYPVSHVDKTIQIRVKNKDGKISNPQSISYRSVSVSSIDIEEDAFKPETLILKISGQNFNASYEAALMQSLVTLNNQPLPFCTNSVFTSSFLTTYGIDSRLFSDDSPCYRVFDNIAPTPILTTSEYQIRVPVTFDINNFSVQLDGMGAPYVHGLPVGGQTTYIINPPTGFVVTDISNKNLTEVGTIADYSTVILRTQSGMTVAEVEVDTSITRDWSSITAGIDPETGRAFVHGLANASGVEGATFTLYVPKNAADNSIVICPGANNLAGLGLNCPNAKVYSIDDPSVSIVWGGGLQQYWKISGLTGTGGMSLALSPAEYFAVTGRQLPADMLTTIPRSPLTGFADSNAAANNQVERTNAVLFIGGVIASLGLLLACIVLRRYKQA